MTSRQSPKYRTLNITRCTHIRSDRVKQESHILTVMRVVSLTTTQFAFLAISTPTFKFENSYCSSHRMTTVCEISSLSRLPPEDPNLHLIYSHCLCSVSYQSFVTRCNEDKSLEKLLTPVSV